MQHPDQTSASTPHRDRAGRPALHIDALCVFRGSVLVIDRLTHHQKGGEICCITGANGIGKSTLLRTLAGRLTADSGRIECDRVRIYVGHADGLSSAISGRENLRSWAQIYGLPDTHEALDQALTGFAATGFADLPVRLLSRGQRRRLALARLCLSPADSLWLLDEPNAGLDQAANERLDQVITAQVAGGGMVLAATHLPLARSAPQSRLVLGGAAA